MPSLFGKQKEDTNKNQNAKKRSVISRNFIIIISIIYSVLIIMTSVSFHVSMARNDSILKDALVSNNRDLYLGKIDALVERLRTKKATTGDLIKIEMRDYNASAGDILGVIIFTKTEDENYFRIADTLMFHDDLTLEITKSEVVREQKEINYLKLGLLQSAVDPDIYSRNGYSWQNVYYPYEIKNKKSVIQLLVSAARTQATIDAYAASTRSIRIVNIIVTVALVIAVIVLSIIFLQNYSLLISNLSHFMKKAADGDLDVSLHQTGDDELNQLALSFNTLIEELKDKTAMTAQAAEPAAAAEPQPEQPPVQAQSPEPEREQGREPDQGPESDGFGAIFITGVSRLKENRLDEAIAIFLTLTIMKPNGFGSFFNLGVAYAKKREYGRAIAMFEEAARINPAFEVTAQYIEKIKGLQNPDDRN
ncbi:MAG: tetratricopeptide repeat protein [Spirochaetes bacterium]|nr:tetratricopeptide repeat protein [Spirochaetota bacterium]